MPAWERSPGCLSPASTEQVTLHEGKSWLCLPWGDMTSAHVGPEHGSFLWGSKWRKSLIFFFLVLTPVPGYGQEMVEQGMWLLLSDVPEFMGGLGQDSSVLWLSEPPPVASGSSS